MNKYSFIGSILLVSSCLMFAFQVLTALLGMGTSDDFVYENIRLVDFLTESHIDWIDSISFAPVHRLTETIITMPLALLLLFGSVLFFLIHIFKGFK